MKRGQSSLESLIMIGFGLIISAAFFSIAFVFITDSISAQQGKDAANRIGEEIDYVYSSGIGTVRYVDVTFPAGTQSVLVGDHRVVVTVQLSSGTAQYFSSTNAPLVGMIDSEPGLERVRIEYLDSEKLLVGSASLSTNPKRLDFALQSGSTASSQINASNQGVSALNGIVSTTDSSISDMVSLSGVPASLASGASSIFNVLINVPGGKSLGIYSGLVTLTSASGETDSTLVVVNVLGQNPSSCSLSPSVANVSQGSSQEFTVSCLDSNSSVVSCPVFSWTTDAGQVIPPTSSTSTTLIVTQTLGTHVTATSSFVCAATLTFNGTTPDTQGPISTITSLRPLAPKSNESIIVNATGDDTTMGNNSIQLCQARMDAGIWNSMAAVDGSYSSPIENVTYTFGNQSAGSHTVYVQCQDVIGNWGNVTSMMFAVNSSDVTGPISTIISLTPPSPLSNQSLTLLAKGDDTTTGNNNIQMCQASLDSGAWNNMAAVDGAYSSPIENVTYNYTNQTAGTHNVSVKCQDSIGNWGSAATLFFNVTAADTVGPIATIISLTPSTPLNNQSFVLLGNGNDLTTGNNTIQMCQAKLDAGIWNNMAASDGSYSSPNENATYTFGAQSAGPHTVYVQCQDSIGLWGNTTSRAFNVTSSDVTGPISTIISLTPPAPYSNQSIILLAKGDDTTTGNNNIQMCQAKMDLGTWNNMTASDGTYSSPIENVTYTFGAQTAGAHIVYVQCQDSLGNWGSATSFAFNVTASDNVGPISTIISITPAAPNTTSSIAVLATGDDRTTGNNNISSCEAKMDAGTWNLMTAVDGSFNSPLENATYIFGAQSKGSHTIYVRCTDVFGNIGNQTSYTFTVTKTIKPILFIQNIATPTATETYWKMWISGHTSAQGYSWTYDTNTVADVTGGVVDVTVYKIVVMAEYPSGNAALNTNLTNYKTGGGYVVLLATALVRGPNAFGLDPGAGASASRSQVTIVTAHNITTGYTVGTTYSITPASYAINYNNAFTGTTLMTYSPGGGGKTALGEGSRVLTYGPARPDQFNANGNTFATRVIDWALAQSTIS